MNAFHDDLKKSESNETKSAAFVTQSDLTKAYKRINNRREEETNQTNEEQKLRSFTVWDFGGQRVFHTVHHLLLNENGIFCLVFNCAEFLRSTEDQVSKLKFWLDSILLHATLAPIIFIGTHCGQVEERELDSINEDLDELKSQKMYLNNLNFEEEDRAFFPVENSLEEESEELVSIRRKVEEICSDPENVLSKEYSSEVPLAWLYFMDSLLQLEEDKLPLETVFAKGGLIGYRPEECRVILRFYRSVGAIVWIEKETENGEALESVVVFNPQWLLDTLGRFLYDPSLHNKKNKGKGKTRRLVKAYEKTGVMPLSLLLDHFLRDKTAEERSFLQVLCFDTLLTSVLSSDWNVNDRSEQTLLIVPCMINDTSEELMAAKETILRKDPLSFNCIFKGPFPTGLFERMASLLVTLAQGYQLNRESMVGDGVALVFLGDMGVLLEKFQVKDFEVNVRISVTEGFVRRLQSVCEHVSSAMATLKNNFLGSNKIESSVVFENADNVLVDYDHLLKAFEGRKEMVTSTNGLEAVKISSFKHLFPKRLVTATERRSAEERLSSRERDEEDSEFDVFLAHDWGENSHHGSDQRPHHGKYVHKFTHIDLCRYDSKCL